MQAALEEKHKTDFENETKAMEGEYAKLIALYEQLGDNDYATEQMRQYVNYLCLLYTSDAADDLLCVDLGGRRIIKKKKNNNNK